LLPFHDNNGYAKTQQLYLVCTSPILFLFNNELKLGAQFGLGFEPLVENWIEEFVNQGKSKTK